MSFIVEPIGYVRATQLHVKDDFWGSEEARIELVPTLSAESLQGLVEFSHAEILFFFHKVQEDQIVFGARHPRNNPNWPLVGIFAQRAKNRPNRIGSTICRILRVQGTSLVVAELDAIDGTPILDIKPVVQGFLPRQTVQQPSWSHELMAKYWITKQRANDV
jgi:tRNA-Thr(GGU) m(6)t(6)A37 methyltransferase TsaA